MGPAGTGERLRRQRRDKTGSIDTQEKSRVTNEGGEQVKAKTRDPGELRTGTRKIGMGRLSRAERTNRKELDATRTAKTQAQGGPKV